MTATPQPTGEASGSTQREDTPSLSLSTDQQAAVDRVMTWLGTLGDKRLTLGGYAGTGKSTLINHIVGLVGRQDVAVCAYTGKAASVLRRKGLEEASTIHRLIYCVVLFCTSCDEFNEITADVCKKCERSDALVVRFRRAPAIARRLVVVDEASMLTSGIVKDLEDLADKVLYVGDHGQLPPIGKDPGLMEEPDIRLEKIHRQAEGSDIIRFAHELRTGGVPAAWSDGDVRVRIGYKGLDLSQYDAILCGFNKTRVGVNRHVRKRLGHDGQPRVGERLICLQNDTDLGLFNGMLVTLTRIRGTTPDVIIADLEDEVGDRFPKTPMLRSQFHRERKPSIRLQRGIGVFDFGYAMTVHKAQGSEWPRVAVFEQLSRCWSSTRWRYTAVTRAAKTLDYILPDRRQ